jgi:hypothetical protein
MTENIGPFARHGDGPAAAMLAVGHAGGGQQFDWRIVRGLCKQFGQLGVQQGTLWGFPVGQRVPGSAGHADD